MAIDADEVYIPHAVTESVIAADAVTCDMPYVIYIISTVRPEKNYLYRYG